MWNEICPYCGYTTDVVMVEVRGVYDGGLYWRHWTNNCGKAWHRWNDERKAFSQSLRVKAQPYIDAVNEKVSNESRR